MTSERELRSSLSEFMAKDALTKEDVRALRRIVYQDGIISRAEAEAMFRLNAAVGQNSDPSWLVFFCEQVVDYIVRQDQPSGYVDEEETDWLLSNIGSDGQLDANEFYMLGEVLRRAHWVPPRLKKYVLDSLVMAVCSPEGSSALSPSSTPGVMGEAEVTMAERAIYAMGGTDGANVSDAEADVLFRLERVTASSAGNSPRWPVLFANAISQHLMGYLRYTAPGVEEMTSRELWVEQNDVSPRGFFKRMRESFSSLDEWFASLKGEDISGKLQHAAEEEREQREQLEDYELKWLHDRLWRDGEISLAEQALLDRLRILKPALAPLIDRLSEKEWVEG